ncbi:MAG: hypothetical protein Unbinned838contig1000_32 [Prokaryotic dsDNA virus sp.]|nr:MAG: hypothetical protein Unbinned838contig1000_32 [Prokaryotic dsDNA virus sp.]
MEETNEIKTYITYILIMIFVFLMGTASNAQATLTDDNFTKVNSGTSVVEFWAPWNETNMCTSWLSEITGAMYYIMNVETEKAKSFKIKVLPTVIIFNDGIEVKRFEGDIKFKLCPKKAPKKVQGVVNELNN